MGAGGRTRGTDTSEVREPVGPRSPRTMGRAGASRGAGAAGGQSHRGGRSWGAGGCGQLVVLVAPGASAQHTVKVATHTQAHTHRVTHRETPALSPRACTHTLHRIALQTAAHAGTRSFPSRTVFTVVTLGTRALVWLRRRDGDSGAPPSTPDPLMARSRHTTHLVGHWVEVALQYGVEYEAQAGVVG